MTLPVSLIPDPSFELGTALDGWTDTASTISLQTHGGSHGSQFIRITAPGTSVVHILSPIFALTPGAVISLGFDSRNRTGARAWTVSIVYYNSSHVEISRETVAASLGGAWNRVYLQGTAAPALTAEGRFVIDGPAGVALDAVDVDAMFGCLGTYTGPMLPAIRLVGDPTDDGFTIAVYGGRGSDKVTADLSDGVAPEVDVLSSGWAKIPVTATGANKSVTYQVRARNAVSGVWEDYGDPVTVNTIGHQFAPAAFSVVAAGCSYRRAERTPWDYILDNFSDSMIAWLGDMWYDDSDSDLDSVHQQILETTWYVNSGMCDVFAALPALSISLDDHDGGWGGNHGYGHDNAGVYACNVAMARCLPVAFDSALPNTRAQVRFVGRVMFLTLDCRSIYGSLVDDPDNDDKTLLGWDQEAWAAQWIDYAAANGLLIVIFSSMVWDLNAGAFNGKTDYWGYWPDARARLQAKLQGRNVVMVDGDLHALRVKNVSDWGGFPVIGVCGAHSNYGNIDVLDARTYYDQVYYAADLDGGGNLVSDGVLMTSFVVLSFADDGSTVTMSASGIDGGTEATNVISWSGWWLLMPEAGEDADEQLIVDKTELNAEGGRWFLTDDTSEGQIPAPDVAEVTADGIDGDIVGNIEDDFDDEVTIGPAYRNLVLAITSNNALGHDGGSSQLDANIKAALGLFHRRGTFWLRHRPGKGIDIDRETRARRFAAVTPTVEGRKDRIATIPIVIPDGRWWAADWSEWVLQPVTHDQLTQRVTTLDGATAPITGRGLMVKWEGPLNGFYIYDLATGGSEGGGKYLHWNDPDRNLVAGEFLIIDVDNWVAVIQDHDTWNTGGGDDVSASLETGRGGGDLLRLQPVQWDGDPDDWRTYVDVTITGTTSASALTLRTKWAVYGS